MERTRENCDVMLAVAQLLVSEPIKLNIEADNSGLENRDYGRGDPLR
jgi:hypothetical protein